MEPVLRFFEGQFGLGALVFIIILGVVACIVWKLASIYTKKTTAMDNLPCDKHEKVIDNLSASVQQINVSLGKLEIGQEDIYKMMRVMASSSPLSQFTQSHSPISLTEKGKEIAKFLDLDNVLTLNWDKIEKNN